MQYNLTLIAPNATEDARLDAISHEEELILQEKLEQDLALKSQTGFDPTELKRVMSNLQEREEEVLTRKAARKSSLLEILRKDLDVSLHEMISGPGGQSGIGDDA